VSKKFLSEPRTTITLIDPQEFKAYRCRLITAKRCKHEKYLGDEWFDFIRDRALKKGDKLLFNFDEPPARLFVEVVPGENLP
jgi:hypothetical protein